MNTKNICVHCKKEIEIDCEYFSFLNEILCVNCYDEEVETRKEDTNSYDD